MKSALAAIALFSIGYYFGGSRFGVLEFLHGLVWHNALGDALHDAVLGFEDGRITEFYAAIRTDFRLGSFRC